MSTLNAFDLFLGKFLTVRINTRLLDLLQLTANNHENVILTDL